MTRGIDFPSLGVFLKLDETALIWLGVSRSLWRRSCQETRPARRARAACDDPMRDGQRLSAYTSISLIWRWPVAGGV